jgi:hypothetical protein
VTQDHKAYRAGRYHGLCELRRVRAQGRIGTASVLSCTKERKALQRELARLRATTVQLKG